MIASERLYGVYLGRVEYVRYKRGAVFIQAKIYSLSKTDENHNEHPWYTVLAPVIMPSAGAVQDEGVNTYGSYFTPQIGDNCLIVFEAGHQGVPYCIGYTPHADDTPVEFDNDDYLDKEREKENRERPLSEEAKEAAAAAILAGGDPAEQMGEINDAYLAKSPIGQYMLMHDKSHHVVIESPETGDDLDPKIELGEDAEWRICLENLAEDFYNHVHGGVVPGGGTTDVATNRQEWEEHYVSNLAHGRKHPKPADAMSKEKTENKIDMDEVKETIKKVAEGLCKAITTADDFIDDPVGTLVGGLTDAVSEYAGDLIPEVDLEAAKDEVNTWLGDLGDKVGTATTEALTDWAGDGALGDLLSTADGQAMSGAISDAAAAGANNGADVAAGFVDSAFDTVMGWADDAGLTDTINDLGAEALGAAIDVGLDAVKDVANDVIGGVVSEFVETIPGLKSGLDIAAGICEGNLVDIAKGFWGLLVDAANVVSMGALTPYVSTLKTGGAALLDSVFQNETDAGEEQVAAGRAE